jgi:hypothetical protein
MGSAQGAGQAVIEYIFDSYLTSDQYLTSDLFLKPKSQYLTEKPL